MPAYALGFLRFKDADRYHTYSRALAPLLQAHGARLLAGDNHPLALAGPPCDRVVLLEFADRDAALRLFESPEYARIAQDRDAGAHVQLQLVNGGA